MALIQQKVTEDTKKDWDAGLNQGLIYRHADQKNTSIPPEAPGGYYGPAKPAYYGESMPLVLYMKAIGLACVAVLPFYTVLDQLGHNLEFQPCNDVSCHYMRLFNSKHIPGTGVSVISVRNGIERPLALHYLDFDAYSCPLKHVNRTWGGKISGDALTCAHLKKGEYTSFLDEARNVKPKVRTESDFANHFTTLLKYAFWITKAPLWLFAWPLNTMAKSNTLWGMEHVPSAICKGKSYEEMQDMCTDINVQNKAKGDKQGTLITNHLRKWGPSKMGVVGGLGGYAALTALHDLALLTGRPEVVSVSLGFGATVCLGIAGVSMFFWAMGAAEVFVSMIGVGEDQCACYYQLPEISALFALSTPFAVFAGFMARVQMQGLAALFGDFLCFQTYSVPHYLSKQSFLWSWAVLSSPKMAGTIQGEPRRVEQGWWNIFRVQQLTLWYLSMFLQVVVALSASSFMIAFKELCVSLYLKGEMTPSVNLAIKYILLPAPSLVTLAVGVIACLDLAAMTLPSRMDAGETFTGQLKTILPCVPKLSKGSALDVTLGYIAFVLGEAILIGWTLAVAQGLCPDRNVLLGTEELTHPKLAQAEMWGACGFIFFFAHVPRVMGIAFSTWEDLESLKWCANPEQKAREQAKYAPLNSQS